MNWINAITLFQTAVNRLNKKLPKITITEVCQLYRKLKTEASVIYKISKVGELRAAHLPPLKFSSVVVTLCFRTDQEMFIRNNIVAFQLLLA